MDKIQENIERILVLMETKSSKKKSDEGGIEMKEEGEGGDTATDTKSSGGYPTVKKHSDTYPTKRGKANMLGKNGEKWESGLTRGKANKIDNSKWESGSTMGSTGP
jgi:hypothetical protein